MLRRGLYSLFACVMLMAGMVGTGVTAGTAHAVACRTWSHLPLEPGESNADVRHLQVRVAGWVTSGERLAYDGVYGARTEAAVRKFQKAYNLKVDGIAGEQTIRKINQLSDSDCTPIHFSYAELNRCNSSWAGGAVSASTAKRNALRVMWKLEAIRHKLGDDPITVSSGFRSDACQPAGSRADSRHRFGDAADLTAGSVARRCAYAIRGKTSGFSEILGQGYDGHNDHTHLAHDPSPYWAAPSCSGF
ncbi:MULTISPECIES: D-Ala-D-Ala carboxypeptidase family metallohydrolase [unclassified Streptomyces]|uniref:D-Ala-D-Ala carboxypeptidase family metallohydrolase n=1 Tax=unclassified Streptomyces TaxID=2593676 RepID=UPI000F71DF5D|nr:MULTISPECIES: D-Ala-D-Ala carboxypeptidase family metallohydrolase [unclassified Streptomyces]AZM58937.1 peptidase M15 [Streptomyces sp. WAC 01438]RSM95124.1 peptidase M15 [Streptomyces sp. WAC 01420]